MDANPFRKALEYFGDGEGWCQGTGHHRSLKQDLPFEQAIHIPDEQRYEDRYCSLGALHKAALATESPFVKARWCIGDILSEQYPEKDYSVAVWNDLPWRTFSEVQQIFEKCAVRWDELLT